MVAAAGASQMVKAVAAWGALALMFLVFVIALWATVDECFEQNKFCGKSFPSLRASLKSLSGATKSP
jgi:hypothetical protein